MFVQSGTDKPLQDSFNFGFGHISRKSSYITGRQSVPPFQQPFSHIAPDAYRQAYHRRDLVARRSQPRLFSKWDTTV